MPKIESYAQGTPSYVELQTPDQKAAKAFYGALFGWEVDEVPLDDEGSDGGNVYMTAALQGDAVAGISGQMAEMAGHPAFWGVYLTVDVLGVGWETMGMEAGSYTCLVVDGRQVGGVMAPQMEGIPPHWNVYFNVESADDTVARAQELGGNAVAPPFDVPGVGRMAVVADPQGAMFSLMQNPSE